MFFPGTKDFDYLQNRSKAEQIEAVRFEFETATRHLEKEISRCEKLEKGYYKIEDKLQERFTQSMKDYQKKSIELEIFKVFEGQDVRSLGTRLQEMKRHLEMQENKESELQQRFASLRAERERLEKTLISIKDTNKK